MKPDGVVKIYDRPIHVSELMSEFPKHMVCRSDSFYIGQKIPSLPMDDQLQLGHSYFLLPAQFFQSDLSFVSIASMAKASLSSKESINALLKKAATCQPLEIEKNWSSGCLRIRVCDEFISEFIQENSKIDERWKSKVCSTPLLQKQYGQLVGSRLRHWKPKLETIKEICEMNKKEKKSQFKNNSNVLTCAKPKALPNSKPKIKIKSSSRK
ncbi:hypothetical protein COLO4_16099 [Corchorus olitorius]|uniref:Uncharacterized protein n=1 Tax=Corchorus olitorius TaxID=93759 RepID=A0A1R3JJK0_9ROSI|nr:hypothetical protein COLO4_16099 [Corchorus olitorius]